MEEGKTIDWQKVVLYLAGMQFVTILVLLYMTFGFAVTYGLILTILIVTTSVSTFAAIKQTRNVRAAEVGLQYVFDRVDGLAIQIDQEIKQMVWAEDVPQVRRIVKLMQDARKELMNAPLLFNGTVVEEIYNPSEAEEIENEDQLKEALRGQLNDAALDMLAEELSKMRDD